MKKNAFTILEVILAIFILTAGVFGSFSLIQQTLIGASLNQSKLVAYYLAQEGLEIIRNIRDGNWLEKRTNPGLSWSDGLLTSCITPRISPCDFYGDVNFDGVVTNEGDGNLISQFIGGQIQLNEDQKGRADVNGDDTINLLDVTAISDYAGCSAGYNFPACTTKSKFQREIIVTPETSDRLRVSAKISWKERERNYNVEVVDYLYNWR